MRPPFVLVIAVASGCGGVVTPETSEGDDAKTVDATPAVDTSVVSDTAIDTYACCENPPGWPYGDTTAERTATPRFHPPAGTSSTAPIDVEITSATAGAVIYYTLDGTVPSTSSFKYSAPIHVTTNTTIKAVAVAPGWSPSEIATASYWVSVPAVSVLAVTFEPPGGTYASDQTVALRSATTAATICYTTDGTSPNCSPMTGMCTAGATYSTPLAIRPTPGGVTLTAIACKAGIPEASARTRATYRTP